MSIPTSSATSEERGRAIMGAFNRMVDLLRADADADGAFDRIHEQFKKHNLIHREINLASFFATSLGGFAHTGFGLSVDDITKVVVNVGRAAVELQFENGSGLWDDGELQMAYLGITPTEDQGAAISRWIPLLVNAIGAIVMVLEQERSMGQDAITEAVAVWSAAICSRLEHDLAVVVPHLDYTSDLA